MSSGFDIESEARRLLDLAEERDLPLRLFGGVAIRLRTPELPSQLTRAYGDLDFVAPRGSKAGATRLFSESGYLPDNAFNTLHGKRRLVFFHPEAGRKTDVFLGAFEMCHEIPLAGRLELEPMTLPLAELLLTKLQIVELNEKDVRDALALLAGHDVGDADGETVNVARVAQLCAADWGLWRTMSANLRELRARVADYRLPGELVEAIERRIETLLRRMDSEPKPRSWRLRARIGDRVRWYELPEDV